MDLLQIKSVHFYCNILLQMTYYWVNLDLKFGFTKWALVNILPQFMNSLLTFKTNTGPRWLEVMCA